MRDAVIDLCRAAVRHVHSLAVEESQSILVSKGSFFQRFVIDAIATAQHGLIVDAVSKSQTWSESLVVSVLRALATVSPGSGTEVGVSAQDIAGVRIGEFRINRGEATKGFAGRQINIVAKAVIQSEFGVELIGVRCIHCKILVADTAEISIVQRGGIGQAKESAGHRIASKSRRVAGAARLRCSKVELSRGCRQAPDVELQHANLAAEFEGVFALDPAYRIVDLEYVIGKLRVAAVVYLVVGIAPLYAWKSKLLYSRKPDLRRVSEAQAIRYLSTETTAEPEKGLVHDGRGKYIVVADAGIARALRSVGAEYGTQIRTPTGIGVIVVEPAGYAVLLGKAVINFNVVEIRG